MSGFVWSNYERCPLAGARRFQALGISYVIRTAWGEPCKTTGHTEVGLKPGWGRVLYVYRPGKCRFARAQRVSWVFPRTHLTCHHWPPCPMNRAGIHHHFLRSPSPHRPRSRPRPPRLPHSPQRGRRARHVSGVEARRLAATTDNRVRAAARPARTASGPVHSTPKGW